MKEVTMYQCEICKETYFTPIEALNCEALGKEEPLTEVGQVVDFKYTVGGGFGSFYTELRIRDIIDRGHFLVYEFEEYNPDIDEWVETVESCWGNKSFKERCKLK